MILTKEYTEILLYLKMILTGTHNVDRTTSAEARNEAALKEINSILSLAATHTPEELLATFVRVVEGPQS